MTKSVDETVNRALSFHRQGKLKEAETDYQLALKAQPDNATALHLLGVIRYQQQRHEDAKSLIIRALEQTPDDLMALGNLGNVHQSLQEYGEAIQIFTKIVQKTPAGPEILVNRGNAYYSAGRFADAGGDYLAALNLNPHMVEASRGLGLALLAEEKFGQAKSALEHWAGAASNSPEPLVSLAILYRKTDDLAAAQKYYEKALTLAPDVSGIHCDLANILRDQGDMKAARRHYEKSIALDQCFGRAWLGLASITKYEPDTNAISDLKQAYEKASQEDTKMYFCYALGKAYEDMSEYAIAFKYFEKANQICGLKFTHLVEDDIGFLEKLRLAMGSEYFEAHKGGGHEDDHPIFIVGMPRSGTSLVEQILASHSKVYGAGELGVLAKQINSVFPMTGKQYYAGSLEKATAADFEKIGSGYMAEIAALEYPSAAHFTDKMPMNFMNIGIIALALPNARIIYCRRDPIDTCLSIYKNYLGTGGHNYACDLESLGKYYLSFHALMEHWTEILPGRIIEIQYEDLVANQETQTRDLLKSCGLSFEEACLEPHKTKRAVSTLSTAQVREPVHGKSVGAWRHYEKQLIPLTNALAPLLGNDDN